jgi:hypothetical protein
VCRSNGLGPKYNGRPAQLVPKVGRPRRAGRYCVSLAQTVAQRSPDDESETYPLPGRESGCPAGGAWSKLSPVRLATSGRSRGTAIPSRRDGLRLTRVREPLESESVALTLRSKKEAVRATQTWPRTPEGHGLVPLGDPCFSNFRDMGPDPACTGVPSRGGAASGCCTHSYGEKIPAIVIAIVSPDQEPHGILPFSLFIRLGGCHRPHSDGAEFHRLLALRWAAEPPGGKNKGGRLRRRWAAPGPTHVARAIKRRNGGGCCVAHRRCMASGWRPT